MESRHNFNENDIKEAKNPMRNSNESNGDEEMKTTIKKTQSVYVNPNQK